MPIKMQKLVREEEARAAGYLWTTEVDPTWMRFQVDFETGAMKGVHIGKCNGTIPRVTPFLYNFAQVAQAGLHHTAVAAAIFADIGKEVLIEAGREFEEDRTASAVSAWQDFMEITGEASGNKLDKSLTESRFITYDADILSTVGLAGIVRIGKKGAMSMPRNRHLKIGSPVSGFEAVKVAMSRNLPPRLKVGAIGDPDVEQAMEALASVARPSSRAVAWYGVRDNEVAKYRMQAAKSFPVLAGLIAESHSLATAVDSLESIQPILMERTGLNKAGLKRIGKLTTPAPMAKIFDAGERIEGEDALGVNRARHTQINGSVPVDMALKYLAELPPDRAPQDDEAWLRFNEILTAVAIPIHNATSIPISKILEASKGNWTAFHESLAKAADFDPKDFDRRTMALTTIDALEAIEHFNRTALLPQALSSIRDCEQPEPMISREFVVSGLDASMSLIVGGAKNIALHMMEISRRYASRIPAMMELEGKAFLAGSQNNDERFAVYGDNGFPLMCDEYTASNGLVVRPLRNGEELTRESARLSHCVGSYQSKARRADCHIFSIQDASGETSHSTVEFRPIEGSDPRAAATSLATVQHRASRNGTPSEECRLAYKEFVDAIKAGGITLNLQELNDWRNYLSESGQALGTYRTRSTTSWKSVLEIDWENDNLRSSYWAEWGQVLGGKVAKSNNPGAVYSEKKSQELVSAMSPRTAAIMIEQAREAAARRKAEKTETPEP